jgi:hypothetical protein
MNMLKFLIALLVVTTSALAQQPAIRVLPSHTNMIPVIQAPDMATARTALGVTTGAPVDWEDAPLVNPSVSGVTATNIYRWLDNLKQNQFNVQAYGAVPGDGVADDVAFNACIAAAYAVAPDSEVIIPRGIWNLTNTITLPGISTSSVSLRGAGKNATQIYSTAAIAIAANGAYSLTLSDFGLYGVANGGQDNSTGLYLDSPQRGNINNLKVWNFGTNIYVLGYVVTIANNDIRYGKLGLYQHSANGNEVRQNYFNGCNVPIYQNSGSGTLYINNTYESCWRPNYIQAGHSVKVIGGYAEANGSTDWQLGGGTIAPLQDIDFQGYYDSNAGSARSLGAVTWNATDNLVTNAVCYFLENGDQIYFEAAVPAEITAAATSIYYVRDLNIAATTFAISSTPGGAAINFSASAAGVGRKVMTDNLTRHRVYSVADATDRLNISSGYTDGLFNVDETVIVTAVGDGPPGVTLGQTYYVKSIGSASTTSYITLSDTVGGATVDITGTTIGVVTIRRSLGVAGAPRVYAYNVLGGTIRQGRKTTVGMEGEMVRLNTNCVDVTVFQDKSSLFGATYDINAQPINYFPNSGLEAGLKGWESVETLGVGMSIIESTNTAADVVGGGKRMLRLSGVGMSAANAYVRLYQSRPVREALAGKLVRMYALVRPSGGYVNAPTVSSRAAKEFKALLYTGTTGAATYLANSIHRSDWQWLKTTPLRVVAGSTLRVQFNMDTYGVATTNDYVDVRAVYIVDASASDQFVLSAAVQHAEVANVMVGDLFFGYADSATLTTSDMQMWSVGDRLVNLAAAAVSDPREWMVTTGGVRFTPATWAGGQARVVGDIRKPTGLTNIYTCIGAGTTGGSEPAWPGDYIGQTVVDGGVTWALLQYKAATPVLTAVTASGLTEAAASALYQATNAVLTTLVATPAMYQATNVDLTSLTSWVTGNNLVTPGTITAAGFISSGSGESAFEATIHTNSLQQLNVTASKIAVYDGNKYLTNSIYALSDFDLLSAQNHQKTNDYLTKLSSGALDQNIQLTQQTTVSNIVDMTKPSTLLTIGGNIAYIYATNGAAGKDLSHVVTMPNWTAGLVTFSIPSTWKTNIYAGAPVNLTNGTITTMYVRSIAGTGDAANQTNVMVSFDYSK